MAGDLSGSTSNDFSVLVLASDLGIDGRPFLSKSDREIQEEQPYDCQSCEEEEEENFYDLEALQFFRLEPGSDKSGNRIFLIIGKYFPAPVISGERLKKYVFHKIATEMRPGEGPYCIVYMHAAVQKDDNSPGLTTLRWIYEELPSDHKDRLQVVYFIHPGQLSRLVFATLGRFFLSGGLYWKIKYVSRLHYLWEDIKEGELEIPEFVQQHDNVLEDGLSTDCGIEPYPCCHATEISSLPLLFWKA